MINKKSIEIYNLSPERENKLWQDCIFVFDTSALLEFYFYSEREWDSIAESIFSKLIGRLWIPQQVEYEYLKGRENVIRKPIQSYNNLINDERKNNDSGHLNKISTSINKIDKSLNTEITTILGHFKTLQEKTTRQDKHPYFEDEKLIESVECLGTAIEDLKTSLGNQLKNFKEQLQDLENRIKGEISNKEAKINLLAQNDTVFEIFNQYLEVGEGYSFSELMEIVKEGELRYRSKIPPGYEDQSDKKGISIYGDLIIWKQIIDYANNVKKPIILIINDIKEDWCYKNEKKIEKPREDLINELYNLTGMELWMYTFSDFVYHAGKLLNTNVDNKVLENIQEIEKELLEKRENESVKITSQIGNIGNDNVMAVNQLINILRHGDNSFYSLARLEKDNIMMPSYHHPQEQDYWQEEVEVENSIGLRLTIRTNLLRVYPETFNNCDAYMDIPMSINPDIQKVISPSFDKTWRVITKPTESPINGYFRGDYTYNNPPAWVFGLRLIQEELS
ncbi:PIN-like domain-containing protein [Anabaena sp. 4-3]|uniref:PIN-like domain-containing protein n=1 Tax=Anabaena sp. 4-3 TaxID=1811979 RepID=UPI00083346C4|nr:PIN-like domain-containing protein [Anabaena sp. 4-3]